MSAGHTALDGRLPCAEPSSSPAACPSGSGAAGGVRWLQARRARKPGGRWVRGLGGGAVRRRLVRPERPRCRPLWWHAHRGDPWAGRIAVYGVGGAAWTGLTGRTRGAKSSPFRGSGGEILDRELDEGAPSGHRLDVLTFPDLDGVSRISHRRRCEGPPCGPACRPGMSPVPRPNRHRQASAMSAPHRHSPAVGHPVAGRGRR